MNNCPYCGTPIKVVQGKCFCPNCGFIEENEEDEEESINPTYLG